MNQKGDLKIGDFGLSRIFEENRSKLTTICGGTPYFMAPELMKGESHCKKADIWACGITLYYICTGKYPFEGKTLYKLGEKIVKSDLKVKELSKVDVSFRMDHLI